MIFYAYFGYPLCLIILSLFKKYDKLQADKDYQLPSVSFIITAYNEEQRIKEKIESTLTQDYPKEKLEIIVASDCSSDKTDEIVKSFESQGVKLVRAPERKGKENAQKHAVDASTGEILVFSDVATILKPDGIFNIVKNFYDPSIGCVSSEDKFIETDGSVSGEGAYVKYEMFLRKLESGVNTLVGLSGSFFAARRTVCENWATDLQSDFNTLLNSIKINLRGISDPTSTGYYKNISDEKKEFNRKVRTVLRGISVLMKNLPLLNPFKYRMFAWQLFSHKLCRWLVPFFLVVAFIANSMIIFSSIYLFLIFLLQIIFYAFAFFYYQKQQSSSADKISTVFRLPFFFVTVNFSILTAWWQYIKGQRATFWEPSKR